MKTRVGIVGLGHRAQNFLPALARMDDVELAALADLDANRLQTAARDTGVARTFTLLSQMLESVKLDAVLILTPDLGHHPQALASLAAGVHVLVEKPPAYTVPEVEEMTAAADRAGKHLMVAWNRTYALLRVKELFAQEPPKLVLANFVRPNPMYLGLIRATVVDPVYFLCGEPDQIAAQGEMFNENQEGHVLASIRFKNGSLGQLTNSYGSGGHSEQFTAYGNGYSIFVESTSRPRVRIMRGGREVESYGPLDTMDIQLRHFIDCVKEDREPLTSGREAVRIMRFMWAIMDAAGLSMPPVPQDGRGWLLWCTCGNRVVPNLERCPHCAMEWAGWSLPIEVVKKT